MNESNIKFGVFIIVMVILAGCIPVACAENTVNQTNASEPYYITIAPIGNVTQGDVFIIHGITNLPSTEVIRGFIIPFYFMTGVRVDKPFVYLGNISVISTPSGVNLWSVNVTDHWGDLPINWSPYQVGIDYKGNLSALQNFTVLPPTNTTRTSTLATTTSTQIPVQTSVISTSAPTQSSPVTPTLPIVAIATFAGILLVFRKKGD
jgi:hypothetical protein